MRFESDRVERTTDGWMLPGRLTLVGTTRPVELQLSYLGSGPDPWGGTRAAFSATTELRRQDFQLNWHQAVGVGIAVFGTTLRVTIDIEAVLINPAGRDSPSWSARSSGAEMNATR